MRSQETPTQNRVVALRPERRSKQPPKPDIHPLDRAITELRHELSRSPGDATVLGRLAALYYRRGELSEAESLYRKALAIAPNRPALLNNFGNVLCDQGKMKEGIEAYEHALNLEKSANPPRQPSLEAVVNLDLAKIENRLIHERIAYLEQAAQLDVSSAPACNALGCGYLLRGLRSKALETFRHAARMDPRNAHAALNIAFVHTLDHKAADFREALAEIAEAVLRFSDQPRLHMHQGEVLEAAGLLDEAEDRYVRAAQADPTFLEAYDVLGRLRESLGLLAVRDQTAQTIEQLLAGFERSRSDDPPDCPSAAALYRAAFAIIARARFERLPLSSHEEIDQLLRQSMVACRIGQGAEHGEDMNLAVKALVLRVQVLESDDRRKAGLLLLESFCQSRDNLPARIWMERGTMALRMGQIDEATTAFDRATFSDPQDAVCYHSLRFAFEGYQRYRSERARFDSAVKRGPLSAIAHHQLALAALSVLKNEEALLHFSKALELDASMAESACGQGRALLRMGQSPQAEAAYERALQIDPRNAEAQRCLSHLRTVQITN